MPRRSASSSPRAASDRLTRARIVDAAIVLADRDGVDALSMRRLGVELGVDPMALYNHVNDKNDLLDAVIDGVIGEIEPAPTGVDWTASLRATILSARRTVLEHPWAPPIIESRVTPTPAALDHMNAVLGILRGGGLSIELSHHALHALGSRVLGFSQDLFDDSPDVRPEPAVAAAMAAQWATTHPYLAEMSMATTHDGDLGGCDDDDEFAFSLDLILDGLERRRAEQG